MNVRTLWGMAFAMALASCVETSTVTCPDGSLCPTGNVCASVVNLAGVERMLCVHPSQERACEGVPDRASCELSDAVAGGACHGGVCLPIACANGFLDPGEACDDENVSNADACSDDCRSTLVCGNAVVDRVRGEDCDLGDAIGHDGCASTCRLEQARWTTLEDERPLPRDLAAFAYDPRRRAAVLFGGLAHAGNITTPLDDTVEWDGERWRTARNATAPSNRGAHTMAYDAARGQLVLFSGTNNQADTWVRTDGSWKQVVTMHAPPARDYAGMVYDSARKQVVLFGGFSTATQTALGDTWVWDGNDWTEVTPASSPPARLAIAMAYDPRRNVSVMFGGSGTVFVRENDVWEFDGTTWSKRTPGTAVVPSPRVFAGMAYDPTSGEVLMVGGNDGTAPSARDAYSWNGTRWLARAPLPVVDSTETFIAHSTATDPFRSRVIVLETRSGRVYEWADPNWITPVGGERDGEQLTPREGAAMTLDPRRNELVMFGGEIDGAGQLTDQTWISKGDRWRRAQTVAQPTARWGAAITYDEVRDQILLYGGCPSSGDTWVWNGDDESWTLRSASSAPGPRCGASLAFDAKRGKAVLVGGLDDTNALVSSTWTWDGTTWSIEPGATPSPRAMAAIAYDRVHERVLLFGGIGSAIADLGDMWSWDGTAWSLLPLATAPPPRSQTRMAWDPARRRIVLAAGYSSEGDYTFSDAYEWDGTAWTAIASDLAARRNHAMASAPDGAGVVVFGGNAVTGGVTPMRLADTLRLRYDGDVSYEACKGVDTDGDGLAGCLDADCWWLCSPLCPPATSCGAGAPTCGDQQCSSLESCELCEADCGACPEVCGDFMCGAAETIGSCPGDCTP